VRNLLLAWSTKSHSHSERSTSDRERESKNPYQIALSWRSGRFPFREWSLFSPKCLTEDFRKIPMGVWGDE